MSKLSDREADDIARLRGKHSPGPWKLGTVFPHSEPGYVGDQNGDPVFAFDPRCMPSKADAVLIASAPEMLEMLRELEWIPNEGSGHDCPSCKWPDRHVEDCKLAALLARFAPNQSSAQTRLGDSIQILCAFPGCWGRKEDHNHQPCAPGCACKRNHQRRHDWLSE